MKHQKHGLLFLFGWLLLVFPVSASASQDVVVPADQIIEGNYYGAGQTVEIVGNVESDVVVAGGNVVITGEVGGDVIAAGGSVRITGPVAGNVRVVAGNVYITSTVGKNISVGTGELVLDESSQVSGHITAGAGALELRGVVDGGVLAGAGQVTITGTIEGPVDLWLDREGSLSVRDGAVLGGQLTYRGMREAQISETAELAQAPRFIEWDTRARGDRRAGWWFGGLVSLFSLLILAAVLVGVMPKKVEEVMQEASTRLWQGLGWGAAWAVLAPIVCILLLVTIIGIPLSLALLAVYLLSLIFTQVFAGATLVAYLRRSPALKSVASWPLIWQVVVGVIVYRLIIAIPYVGWVVAVFGTLVAWGAWLQIFKRTLVSFRT